MSDSAAPLEALRRGALVREATELGTLEVTGADRLSWLNGLVTCDLTPLRAGAGAYGFAVAKNGKILGEVRILVGDDRLLVGVEGERVDALRAHFDEHLIMEDAEIRGTNEPHAWFLAHGPLAPLLVTIARDAGGVAAAMDMTGLGGAVVAIARGAEARLATALRGAPVSPLAFTTAEEWDALRVMIGVPRFGADFGGENYPQESSLEPLAVSFNKGCYLGQETVFMLQMRGHVKQKLVRLAIEGARDVPVGAEVATAAGEPVGSITSRVRAPDAERVIALGFVKYKHIAPGTELVVSGRRAVVGAPLGG